MAGARIEGMDALIKRLNNIGANADKAVDEALFGAAIDGARVAKTLAPVRTGALRRSIRAERKSPENGRPAMAAGGSAFLVTYARPVEFGHRTRSGSRVPAQPYMRPAAAWINPTIPKRIANALKGAI